MTLQYAWTPAFRRLGLPDLLRVNLFSVGLKLIRALVANDTRIIYVTELSASSSEQVLAQMLQ